MANNNKFSCKPRSLKRIEKELSQVDTFDQWYELAEQHDLILVCLNR